MSATTAIFYPESDGAPMGENTLQVQWIVDLFSEFKSYFRDRPNVFLAADLFWYPVEGRPKTVTAPDLMFVFGRPMGKRPSYKQWDEGGIAPQVVIEVLSPSNTPAVRAKLRAFYERYGVEEFYEYDPDAREFTVHLRSGRTFLPAVATTSHASARLGVRFEIPPGEELRVIGANGQRFRTHQELTDEATAAQEAAVAARREAARLAAKLRALGIDPDAP